MAIFTIAGASAAENFDSFSTRNPLLEFVVTLSEPLLDVATVNYRTLLQTAQANQIEESPTGRSTNGTLEFAPGETSKTIQIENRSDSVEEVDKNLVVELYDPSGAGFVEGSPVVRATGVILDNDGAGSDLAIFVSDPVITEGDDGDRMAVFEVELSRPIAAELEVSYATRDLSATAGEDYTSTTGTLTFNAGGQRTATVSVPVLSDDVGEAAERFALVVTPPETPTIAIGDAVGEATILDTDTGPRPEISIAGDTILESYGYFNTSNPFLRFVVTLSEPSLDVVTVNYRTLADSALDLDIEDSITSSNVNGTLSFAPGETSKQFFVETRSDEFDEADQALTVELFDPTGADFPEGTPVMRAQGVILDNDGAGSNLAVFVSDPVVTEGDEDTPRTATFEVQLSQPVAVPVEMTYATRDITARAGQDYVDATGTLSFAAGQQSAFVTVEILGDDVGEGAETFALAVTPPDVPSIDVADAVGEALILDTDTVAQPEISIAGDTTAEDYFYFSTSAPFLRFVVSLSEPSLDVVTVNYRTLRGSAEANDTDDSLTSSRNNGSVTFAPGETSKSIFIESRSDAVDEVDQNLTVELFDPVGGAFPVDSPVLRADGVLLDTDGAGPNRAVFVSDPVVTEGDGDTRLAVFEVSLSRPVTDAIELSYRTRDITAVAGQDYTAVEGTLSFAPGQTTASVAVEVRGDTIGEIAERFALIVTPPETPIIGTEDSVGEALIIDTDTSVLPEVSVAGDNTLESFGYFSTSGPFLRFVVTLSEASLTPVTVDYSTVEGSATREDVDGGLISGTLTFEPGETSKSIFLEAESDDIDERDEAIFLRITNPDGAVLPTGQRDIYATGFIRDNDGLGPNLSVSAAPATVAESGEATANYWVEVTLSNPSEERLSFDARLASVTGTVGDDIILLDDEVVFEPGETVQSVRVQVLGDATIEAEETVELLLTPGAGVPFVGEIAATEIAIVNGPALPTPGDDLINGTGNADVIDLLAGDDTANGGGGDDDLFGNTGNDELNGDAGDDTINGWSGDDTIDGGAGADLLIGGQGSDVIFVDDVGDRVAESRKWAGSDTVISSVDFRMGRKHIEDLELTGEARLGAGNGLRNTITGNDADNVLDGGKNVDTLIGGLGDDRYLVRAPGDNAVEQAGEGTDTVLAFRAYALDDHIENLFLQTLRNDAGQGIAGVNGIGNDLDNLIVGNPFDNVIQGREGNDTLRGQAGADTFVFDRALGADNVDTIVDFNTNAADEGDTLRMVQNIFRGVVKGQLDDAQFVAGTAAQDAGDRFIFDAQTRQLWFDIDGRGGAAQQLVATFERRAVVEAEDIFIF